MPFISLKELAEKWNYPMEKLILHLQDVIAVTTPDPRDGHVHVVLKIDEEGNGKTEPAAGTKSAPHSHDVEKNQVIPRKAEDGSYISEHPGGIKKSDMSTGGDEPFSASFQETTTIQTLIFDKKKFDAESASKWASEHDFKSEKKDETENSIRIRQRDPGEFKPGSFRTISLRDGVKAVIGRPKEQMSDEAEPPEKDEPFLLEKAKFTMTGDVFDVWAIPRKKMFRHIAFGDYMFDPMEFMSAPFSVYGGKRNLAPQIARLVPPHRTYIEPFAGAGAVLFARDNHTGREILTDIDQNKVETLRFLKTFTPEEGQRLLQKPWHPDRRIFAELRASNPTDRVDRFHKYMYTRWNSFGKRGDSYAGPAFEATGGHNAKKFIEEKMPRFRERLKNVEIGVMDWKAVIQKFDASDTFFYLDPPYIGTSNDKADHFTAPSAQELGDTIKGIKGKWLLSNHDVPELHHQFSDFAIRKVNVSTNVDNVHDTAKRVRAELLISNYRLESEAKEMSEFFSFVEGQVQSFADLPLAARDRPWDADMAVTRLRRWAGVPDGPGSFDKYFRGFMWRDRENKENFTAYKLPFADIIDGRLMAVPRAIFAVSGVLSGARGGVDIPTEDATRIRGVVSQYFKKMRGVFKDETLKPAFERE